MTSYENTRSNFPGVPDSWRGDFSRALLSIEYGCYILGSYILLLLVIGRDPVPGSRTFFGQNPDPGIPVF
jgi:hypothetical protein